MILWLSVAAMTVVALAGVFWPLLRGGGPARSGSDVAVYRDQLQEINRDLTLGLISAPDADAARVEVSRRMLNASETRNAQVADAGWSAPRAAMAAVAALLLTAGASGLYLRVGAPGLTMPAVAAEKPTPDSVDRLVAQAEEHLAKSPNDVRGWEVLAPVYMRLGRYGDSANAWRNVIQISGPNADRLANLGEALTAEANGVVIEEAKDAFERSVKLDPTTVTARYYLGIAAEQDGKRSKAAELFRQLIADAPQGAHWVAQVKTALARVEGQPDGAPVPAAAAAQIPPDNSMIRGMVEGLAARLKQDGSDADGWVRLVRSYGVLNESDKKTGAIADARKALSGEKLAAFEKGLAAIESGAEPPAAAAASSTAVAGTASAPPHGQGGPGDDPTVRGMVERLAARLKQDGSDVDGWVKLVRSYKVLNDAEAQRAAVVDARRALAGDAEKLARLDAAVALIEQGKEPPPPTGQTGAADHNASDMVARLAARLARTGSDPEGWLMLTRSYATLQQSDKEKEAIRNARAALAGEPDKLDWFNQSIKRFKLE